MTREGKIRNKYIRDRYRNGFNNRQCERKLIEIVQACFIEGRDRDSNINKFNIC